MDWLYNSKEGTVLGRTAMSWLKILTFYVIYYSFLAGLTYVSISLYQKNLPATDDGSMPFNGNKRLDQPGLQVYPFVTLRELEIAPAKRDDQLIFNENGWSEADLAYNKTMVEFLEALPAGTTNKDLSQLASAEKYKALNDTLKARKPIFLLTVSKILKWEPINTAQRTLDQQGQLNPANSVGFNCYEIDATTNKMVETSNFNVNFLGVNYLAAESFPYENAEANRNKRPFAVFQIEEKTAGTGFEDNKVNSFRCEAIADNIDRPFNGNTDNLEGSSLDNAIKNAIGHAQFAIGYEKKAE